MKLNRPPSALLVPFGLSITSAFGQCREKLPPDAVGEILKPGLRPSTLLRA